MRDLYADIPGLGVQKLNAANAYGGGLLLVQTIEENYKIHIDNYASVDFSAMIDIVDLVAALLWIFQTKKHILRTRVSWKCAACPEKTQIFIISVAADHSHGWVSGSCLRKNP